MNSCMWPIYKSKVHLSLYRRAGDKGTGSIAPTHFRPPHQTGVSGQCHAPAALCPGERTPVPIVQEAGLVWSGLDTEARGKILCRTPVAWSSSL
jgi:hypothetical protein